MLHRLWHNWNWGGIFFCFVMFIFIPAAMWGTERIRRWSIGVPPQKTWDELVAAMRARAVQWRDGQPNNLIDSTNYRPPHHAVHTIDFARSQTMIRGDGKLLAKCSVQGCSVMTVIGRDVSTGFTAEETTAYERARNN
jgi:hypothetical protein